MPRRLLAKVVPGLLAALAGCDGWEAEPPVRLPPGMVEGAGDPRRWALAQAVDRLLDRPESLAGRPAEAALAAGLVEYLATAFQDGRYPDGRHVTRLLRDGRAALRSAIGLRTEPALQESADGLFAAAGRHAGAATPLAALVPLALPGSDPWAALAMLGLPSGVPRPLQRALRAARDMVGAETFTR